MLFQFIVVTEDVSEARELQTTNMKTCEKQQTWMIYNNITNHEYKTMSL